MLKINILGSTGSIGKKALSIIENNFGKYKINFLLANNNYKLLAKQAILFKPKYIGIVDEKNYLKLKKIISNNNIKILTGIDCIKILENKVDSTIISISGIEALNYLENAIKNSKNIGIVNKESIVSAGKFINKLAKKYDNLLFPLDSEHYSIYNFLENFKYNNIKKISKVFLTASGGPFLNSKIINLKNKSLKDTLKHPTWKMGMKNTIDSATMVNKCLEIIEAHYLFNFKYSNLDIIIHPESLVHSIIEFKDSTLIANISDNNMSIPIFNFLNLNLNKNCPFKTLNLANNKKFSFYKPDKNKYKILKIFDHLDKNSVSEIIVFNTSNEIAVKNFVNNKISFTKIIEYIDKSLNKFEKTNINNINEVIQYQNYVYNKLYKT